MQNTPAQLVADAERIRNLVTTELANTAGAALTDATPKITVSAGLRARASHAATLAEVLYGATPFAALAEEIGMGFGIDGDTDPIDEDTAQHIIAVTARHIAHHRYEASVFTWPTTTTNHIDITTAAAQLLKLAASRRFVDILTTDK